MSQNVRLLTPNVDMTFVTPGMVVTDGADTFTGQQPIAKFTVPEGEVIGIPRLVHVVASLFTDDAATKLDRYAFFSFGLITPSDPNRIVPIGQNEISYTDYYDLDTAKQRDPDYLHRFTHIIARETCPIVVIREHEILVICVKNDLLGVDVSESLMEFPIYRGRPGSITQELKWRRAEIGR